LRLPTLCVLFYYLLAYVNQSLIDLIKSSSLRTKLRVKRMDIRQQENIRKCTGEVNVKDLKGDVEDGEPWEFFLWTRSGAYNFILCGVEGKDVLCALEFCENQFSRILFSSRFIFTIPTLGDMFRRIEMRTCGWQVCFHLSLLLLDQPISAIPSPVFH